MQQQAQPNTEARPASRRRHASGARRHFSPEYKLQILEVADCAEPDDVRALLERERLSSSHLSAWRRQRKRGTLPPPPPLATPKTPATADEATPEIARLQAEVARLQCEVDRLKPLEHLHRQLSSLLDL